MKLATFATAERVEYGIVYGDEICVVSRDPGCPRSVRAVLVAGAEGMRAVERAARSAPRITASSVRLLAPIPKPRKFLAVGNTYNAHAKEAAKMGAVPAGFHGQAWFNKQTTCIAAPYDPVHKPRISSQLDYEGELALVIGRLCRNVPRGQAPRVIAGYCICNDFSVRDWQRRSPTGTLGKSFDTHGPCGPWLVTADEIEDPQCLELRTLVNGELRQHGSTREMRYTLGELIEEVTTAVTLEPGDILSTGTPGGVGASLEPPRYLEPGDVVRVEVEHLGYIENRVIEEPDPLGPLMPSLAPIESPD